MKLIKPSEISSKIMTMIDESDKKVILISPYCKISKWYKLQKKIQSLIDRKIELEVYIRKGEENSKSEIENMGITPMEIPDLHCKLYLNEKYGIVSSMNLLLSSDINSLEIGYITETGEEYNDLVKYYERYINKYKNTNAENNNKKHTQKDIKVRKSNKDWRSRLYDQLNKIVGITEIYQNNDILHIKTKRNNYESFISNNNKNYLRIMGILSFDEYNRIRNRTKQIEDKIDLSIEVNPGDERHYSTIWGQSRKSLKSYNMNDLYSGEQEYVVKNIYRFIKEVEEIKGNYY